MSGLFSTGGNRIKYIIGEEKYGHIALPFAKMFQSEFDKIDRAVSWTGAIAVEEGQARTRRAVCKR